MVALHDVRKSKGFTLDEIAKHCGISESEMKEIENDPINMPASIAIKLRNLYKIPVDYIDL